MNSNFVLTIMELNSKIVVGLGRISEVFKVLLWEQAKKLKLSPIQIQILHFIAYHKDELCNVSYLAKEFNVTKPTISDAIRVLVNKELLIKDFSNQDCRSYTLFLSVKGKETVKQSENFAEPIKKFLNTVDEINLESMYATISQLIFQLNKSGILSVQRTCFGCKFYEKQNSEHYCNLLEAILIDKDVRLDCSEFELKH